MSRSSRVLAAAALAVAAAAPAAAVIVPSNQAFDTIVGTVVAGQSYSVTITGASTLCFSCNGGGALRFNSNGIPIGTVVAPYTGFSPDGSNEDPSTPGIDYGLAGSSFKLGALVFIFAAPGGSALSSSFSLQDGQSFVAPGTGTLNAIVNDTNYSDNAATGFAVTLASASAAVPEPATWGMMIVGFGLVGLAARRRRHVAVALA